MDMDAELMKVLIEESGKFEGNVNCASTYLQTVYSVSCGLSDGYRPA